jgi:hypothetical protein
MQHADQHIEAIKPTIRVTDMVEASVFSDKIKEMGYIKVSKGRIEIRLDFVPSMVSEASTRDFLMDAIGLALRSCYDARPQAFDPHS